MKDLPARITNDKCIKDSEDFRTNPIVTCLVEENESGKRANLGLLGAK
jgi:hypothetical protein